MTDFDDHGDADDGDVNDDGNDDGDDDDDGDGDGDGKWQEVQSRLRPKQCRRRFVAGRSCPFLP